MKIITAFDNKKATQALNFLALKEGGLIDKLKVVKLMWLADRLHIRKYGRPIFNDIYFAMPYGAVGSSAKDLAGFNVDGDEKEYLENYLELGRGYKIKSKQKVDLDIFSDSEIEALEKSYREYGQLNQFDLAELSHKFPEWEKFREVLTSKSSTRELMDYDDFFKNPSKDEGFKNIFNESAEILKTSEEAFSENIKVASYWF
ncbi:MAG: hypothetical protein COV62_01355 [Candidatus Nealsonbacteria bacterium CG11_big_fil_rev_8_21_14_0_20_35_11]|uniref:Antitoxin SocA-like Panacea domain-containing protein n=2 Tax=Bacteria candidate phyla TaxID=1783234 RepID=A0A2H0UY69_9BACT|nr:MAG: hypothetical protein COV62_01355 [Candidatus Nealsonbacteria bacterium CG11_big_fil_rev_8_21_14_0_20_35_11]PIR91747.1 MAG: hypothetical protein COU03_00680 [bacterium (Candidatus Gribaldobacteria) CG10_big_fil_rev_8_21_14_0_10_41_12]